MVPEPRDPERRPAGDTAHDPVSIDDDDGETVITRAPRPKAGPSRTNEREGQSSAPSKQQQLAERQLAHVVEEDRSRGSNRLGGRRLGGPEAQCANCAAAVPEKTADARPRRRTGCRELATPNRI